MSLSFFLGIDVVLPLLNSIDFVGQAFIQLPQEKQSGVTLCCFKMASIASDGQALEHSPQAVHVL